MLRSLMPLVIGSAVAAGLAVNAAGQAMLEYGLGAARASTTTSPAAGVGKAMGGLIENVDKTIKSGQQSSPSDSGTSSATTRATRPVRRSAPAKSGVPAKSAARVTRPAAVAAPEPPHEDPARIEPGLGYDDLVHRFGRPSMEISSGEGTTLAYASKSGTIYVEVEEGKVTSVDKPKS